MKAPGRAQRTKRILTTEERKNEMKHKKYTPLRQLKLKEILPLAAGVAMMLYAVAVRAGASMPVIAYMGPVVDHLSQEEYADMAACGFTHAINIYNSTAKARTDMQNAGKAGIRVFVHTPQVVDRPREAASELKGCPALAGYFLADEPSLNGLEQLAGKVRTIRGVDAVHPCYVNLHPFYDNNQLKATGAGSYRQYVQAASAMGLPQISFDFYPVTRTGMRPAWFYTLNEIRRESLRRGVPFWGFVLSVPHGDYPAPTWASLRLQAYVNLVYGAQAIEYFTYRTPVDDRYHFHDAPIGLDGRKTRTYDLVKSFNAELKPVASLFYQSQIKSVGHLVRIPDGCAKFVAPRPVKSLVVKGKKGVVAAVFNKNGHTYMAVVNKDYKETATFSIETSDSRVAAISKKLRAEKLKKSYTLQAGDIQMFRIK